MKRVVRHVCSACGAHSPSWRGQCSKCGEWNTLKPEEAVKTRAGVTAVPSKGRPQALTIPQVEASTPFSTGLRELDELLGRGWTPGASTLLAGPPGIGKSTLLLKLAGLAAGRAGPTVYVSAEESLARLRERAERLGVLTDDLLALSTTALDEALGAFDVSPGLVIVDSVQMLGSARIDGLPGSVSQVRATASELIAAAAKSGAAVVLVGHVTKDGQIAGPMLLEHMVDAVLSLEGDRKSPHRLLRAYKNRFGPTDDLIVFRMEEGGMAVVEDPALLYLDEGGFGFSGAVPALAVDGKRPFMVEVQALAAKSFLPAPRRVAQGVDVNRVHLLLAVLEKRLSLNFGGHDVYVKIGGGGRLADPGLDLPLTAAVLSSFWDRPVPERCVLWGELDLNGRVRPAALEDLRLAQARRLGYDPLVKDRNCKTLPDAVKTLFPASGRER